MAPLVSADNVNLGKARSHEAGVFTEVGAGSSGGFYEQENSDVGQLCSFLFDESSGSVTESINSLSFSAAGSPTYAVPTQGGLFVGWGTGITFAANTNFSNTSAGVCSPGTDDFVIEFGFKTTSTNSQAVFHCLNSTDQQTMWCEVRPGTGIQLFLAEPGVGNTSCVWAETGGIDLDDGFEHKVKIVLDRSANATCRVDNVPQGGSIDISARGAATFDTDKFYIGTFNDLSEDFLGTLFFLRFVQGLTANLSGPGGVEGETAVPDPAFKVFSDGTITPTLGQDAKTHSRAGSIHYWDALDHVTVVAEDAPQEHALPSHYLAYSSTREGVLINGLNRNEIQYSNQFDQWDLIGSATVTANYTSAPDGTTTADRLQTADGEGIELTLVQNATDFSGPYGTWGLAIKANSGTPTIKLRIKDTDDQYWINESHPEGFTVTSEWRFYECWGKTFHPGVGFYIAEITSDGAADVSIAFATFQFTGQGPLWDHHSLGHIPSYKGDAGAARESTDFTNLSYTSTQVTGTISEYTVNQWVFIPDIDTENYGYDFFLFSTESAAAVIKASLQHHQTDFLSARFGNTTAVTSSAHNLRRMIRGRWAMVTYAMKSGDSSIYLDGVEIFTDSNTFSSFTIDYFSPGQADRSLSGAISVENFGWPMGSTQVWKGSRLTDAQIAEIYADEVGDDAIDSASTWDFPTTGAVDVVRFDAIDGNITSEVEALTLTETGAVQYLCQGVQGVGDGSGLKGCHLSANGYFNIASLPVAYNIGALDNFTIMTQVYIPKNVSGLGGMLFDCSDNGTATDGYMALVTSTNVDFYVYSGGTGHVSRWAHGGLIRSDSKFYTLRWVFNRSNTSAELYYKAAGETEVGPITTTRVLTDFNSLGAIAVSGTNMRFGVQSNGTSSELVGSMFQWAFAKSTTYDATNKP